MTSSRAAIETAAALVAAALAVAAALLIGNKLLIDLIIRLSIFGLLAMSLNLLIGYTGLVSFGHAMFFGAGAYAFGLLMQSGGVSIPAAFLLSLAFVAVLALVVGA